MPSPGPTLGEVGESGVLEQVFAALEGSPSAGVQVGPGDDTALLKVRRGALLATTDTMVRGPDWRDDWSTAFDVGVKAVTQNLADLAAMGGTGTGLLVTLVAERSLPLAWARELTEGLAWGCTRAGVPVLGGDLNGAGDEVVMVSITALGELGEDVQKPVLRSGARAGDVVAVSGPLGRSAAGLALLLEHGEDAGSVAPGDLVAELLAHHLRPLTDLTQGPAAARLGATAMIDVSDGLVRDGDRVARASGVVLELAKEAVAALADRLAPAVGGSALGCVLGGGEEHELLACFPGEPPAGWTVLGRVIDLPAGGAPGVVLGGSCLDPRTGGWDHFGG
ncbi:thiamine-phosphate kinase [Ornithinimicrobium pratense]|uniref:Thiamine-monophosphate kinase n=2 Tax=Ornithinimicrobium pratense TaxID=2593973 RepID=A0A5J6VA59_9MICO|nr:thiamine-phosphate kinase [Ornithinimicrobium pratense]